MSKQRNTGFKNHSIIQLPEKLASNLPSKEQVHPNQHRNG